MGVLDFIKMIGGGVAAPFTGGATLPVALDGLSGILGSAAKTGQDQNNKADQLQLLLENAKLNRDKFALDAPGQRLSTGMRANVAANAQPASLDWGPAGFKPGAIAHGQAPMPHWTGGPSSGLGASMSPDAKQLSNQVMHDELVAQLRGGTTGGGTGAKQGDGSLLRPGAKEDGTGTDLAMDPKLAQIGQPSTGDNVLGGLGVGTSILALLSKLRGGNSQMPTGGGTSGGNWYDEGVG